MEELKREAKRVLLSTMHASEALVDRMKVERILKNYDMEVIQNEPPKKVRRVTFLITRMVKFHGGQTSILRLGTMLARQGFEVIYAVYKPQSREEMRICATSNLKNYEGKLCTAERLKTLKTDVIVATSFDTVSFVKKMGGYKMYFVQDYEPYFYPFGELFLLAKKTYEQGLHMVSLGNWNKEMIERECRPVSPLDVIEFPYEKSEYPAVGRDYLSYRDKKKLTMAVYLKFYGKRLPTIIPYMLTDLKERLGNDGIDLEICYFGEAKSFRPKGGTNLGMLTKEELAQLYRRADFGMVASLSNISLVPFEMAATGLPVIEFADGTFSYFFPPESAILTEVSCEDLYRKVKLHLEQPELLEKEQANAMGYMENLSWEASGAQFAEILRKLPESTIVLE